MRLNIATFEFGIGEVAMLRDLGFAGLLLLLAILVALQIAEKRMRRRAVPRNFRRFQRNLYFGYAAGVGIPGFAILSIGKLINSILRPSPDHVISQFATVYVCLGTAATVLGCIALIAGVVIAAAWMVRQRIRNFTKE